MKFAIKNKNRWIMTTVFILFLLITSACASPFHEIGKNKTSSNSNLENNSSPANEPASDAKEFQLEGLNKEILNSSELNKPMVMMYWATWCHFCKEELPMLNSLYEEYADRVAFAAVNLTHVDSIKSIEKYMSENKMSLPVYLDHKGDVTKLFRIISTPTTIILDREGNEFHRKVGAGGKNVEESSFRTMLDELLAHDS